METLGSKELYLCMKMHIVMKMCIVMLILVKKFKRESYLGNPEVEACFP